MAIVNLPIQKGISFDIPASKLNHFECVKILLWQEISWCNFEAVEGTLKLSCYWRMSCLMCMGPLCSSGKILQIWRGCLCKITLHAVFGYFITITLLRQKSSQRIKILIPGSLLCQSNHPIDIHRHLFLYHTLSLPCVFLPCFLLFFIAPPFYENWVCLLLNHVVCSLPGTFM